MDKSIASEVRACLSRSVDEYPYDEHHYALNILEKVVGEGMDIRFIKRSPYAGLLRKPVVEPLLSRCGHGRLKGELLREARECAPTAHQFRITFGRWDGRGEHSQVTRRGEQLVVQVNFPEDHDAAFRRKVKPGKSHLFRWSCHPVNTLGAETLGWARIDLDLNANEALIEEIQTDWLREAQWVLEDTRTYKGRCCLRRDLEDEGIHGGLKELLDYIEQDLKPYFAIWQEVILSACIDLLAGELGIRRIFYHNHRTGARLKDCSPPKSVYRDLPKRFCMRSTPWAPGFIQADKQCLRALQRINAARWYLLDLSRPLGARA